MAELYLIRVQVAYRRGGPTRECEVQIEAFNQVWLLSISTFENASYTGKKSFSLFGKKVNDPITSLNKGG